MGAREASNLVRQTHHLNNQFGDTSVPARNLRDNQLGGLIFGCKHDTIEECLSKQLFGLPAYHFSYVRNVKPGLPLFLFNYSDRKMHGIFEAASPGQMSIDAYAWSKDGSLKTPFPAQVCVCTKTQYQPILENQFKKVIGDNYYNHSHFYFELDHVQTRALISLFKSSPVPANLKQVPAVSSKRSIVVPLPSTKRIASVVPIPMKSMCNTNDFNSFGVLSNSSDLVPDNWGDSNSDNASLSKTSHSNHDVKDSGDLVSDWEDLDDNVLRNRFGCSNSDKLNRDSSDKTVAVVEPVECSHPVFNPVNEERYSSHEDMSVNSHNEHTGAVSNASAVGLQPDGLTILKKLQQLSVLRQQETLPSEDVVNSSSDQYVSKIAQANASLPDDPFGSTVEDDTSLVENASFEQCRGNDELLQIIAKLTKRTEALEKKQIESNQEILFLRGVVKDSDRRMQQLENRIEELQLNYNSSLSLLNGTCNDLDKPSIFLIGGYNGVAWLSSLDSFSPKTDRLVPLNPMSSARSYASVAALKDHIFVLGGGDGASWYHTVECYNTRSNEWMTCPRLNHEKGSLAGAILNDKIFAIGGGDGNETFSEVEMFDPVLGKWIHSQSMLQRRFALAAAELNGAIYVSGGYDGSSYLQSAERYDPREGFWVRLPCMDTRRGCHSVAVLGEVLYALGGYNGDNMVSSVEIFDPRLDAWRMGDPMNSPRGYASMVTLDDSLFIIGGLQPNEQIVDTVEVYSTSVGWSVPGFKSIGKRCFSSAIVL